MAANMGLVAKNVFQMLRGLPTDLFKIQHGSFTRNQNQIPLASNRSGK
jgi:hypothetical protein